MPKDNWVDKLVYIYNRVTNYTAVTKDEILPFGRIRMKFIAIMLSELSQVERDKC